jgi:hypothetical protein
MRAPYKTQASTSAELEEYVRKLKDEGPYERMLYVYREKPKQMMSG